MLKISIHETPEQLLLKIEGRLISPWSRELETLWSHVADEIGQKHLCLNLCGTTFVDPHGMEILRRIVHAKNPEILADSPLTRQFAKQARQTREVACVQYKEI
jgi:hypothetical protein